MSKLIGENISYIYDYPFVIEHARENLNSVVPHYSAVGSSDNVTEAIKIVKDCKKRLPNHNWFIYDTKQKVRTKY